MSATIVCQCDLQAHGAITPVAQVSSVFELTASGESKMTGTATISYRSDLYGAVGRNEEYLPDDRFRVIVQATRTGEILSRDMTVTNLTVQRQLSGWCSVSFDIDSHDPSVAGIEFKAWGQYVHLEKTMQGKRRIWATALVQPSEIDKQSGVMHLTAKGFANYPKGMPWLENINWATNDIFDPVVEIWNHLQSYPGGNLNVQVYPQKSGVEMLPGYAYNGTLLNPNYYASFIRAVDKLDCGDYIDALAKSSPFDYREESEWNADRTDVIKRIHLGYPRLGDEQAHLAFVLNENVLAAQPHTEVADDWVSDIGISGWFPGVEVSAELTNADPDRLRRYLNEEDLLVDSNERAAAWAHRKLARRQAPPYWETITIIPDHPNAPFGTFDVGDTITVSGYMPFVGDLMQDHKIMAIAFDEKSNTCQLTLKAEGMFNYDPIYFPDGQVNMVENPNFDNDLRGWNFGESTYRWDGTQGVSALGSATVTANGATLDLLTDPYGVSHFQQFPLSIYVKCTQAVSTGTPIQLRVQFYDDDLMETESVLIDALANPVGTVAWRKLAGNVITPVGSTHAALCLRVDSDMTAGQVWVDDAELTL